MDYASLRCIHVPYHVVQPYWHNLHRKDQSLCQMPSDVHNDRVGEYGKNRLRRKQTAPYDSQDVLVEFQIVSAANPQVKFYHLFQG